MHEWAFLLRHIARDVLALVAVGLLPSLAMMDRERKGAVGFALVGILGLALLTTSIAHIRLFETLVKLPEYGWVHKLTLAVVFGVLALPVAWVTATRKIKPGWVLIAGLLGCSCLFSQGVAMQLAEPNLAAEISMWRTVRGMKRRITIRDAGGLARIIERVRAEGDSKYYDLVFKPILEEALWHKHPSVARAAATKLAEGGDPDALPHILEAMTDAPPEPRRAVRKAARNLVEQPGAGEMLVKVILNHPGPPRYEALELMSAHLPGELQEALPQLLRSPEVEVREVVAKLIKSESAGLNISELTDGLLKALNSDDIQTSGSAAQSLVALGDLPQVTEKINPKPLIRLLTEGGPRSRRAAARLLNLVEAPKAVPALIEAAKSEDKDTTTDALNALVSLKAGEAREVFRKALMSDHPRIRELGYQGLRQVLPRNVRQRSEVVRTIVRAVHRERHPAARRSAAELLAWLDLPGAFRYADALQESASETADKLAAVRAFSLLGEEKAIRALLKLTGDADAEVRKAAVEAVGNAGDSSMIPRLKRLQDDPDPEVREAVESAIRRLSKRPPPKEDGDASPGEPSPPEPPESGPTPPAPEPPPW